MARSAVADTGSAHGEDTIASTWITPTVAVRSRMVPSEHSMSLVASATIKPRFVQVGLAIERFSSPTCSFDSTLPTSQLGAMRPVVRPSTATGCRTERNKSTAITINSGIEAHPADSRSNGWPVGDRCSRRCRTVGYDIDHRVTRSRDAPVRFNGMEPFALYLAGNIGHGKGHVEQARDQWLSHLMALEGIGLV